MSLCRVNRKCCVKLVYYYMWLCSLFRTLCSTDKVSVYNVGFNTKYTKEVAVGISFHPTRSTLAMAPLTERKQILEAFRKQVKDGKPVVGAGAGLSNTMIPPSLSVQAANSIM